MAPINELLHGKKKNENILSNPNAKTSFIKIKQALVSAPILSQPVFNKRFTIQSDASDFG